MAPQASNSALLAKRLLSEGVSLIEAPCTAGDWRFDAVGQDEHTARLCSWSITRKVARCSVQRLLERSPEPSVLCAAIQHLSVQP